MLNVGRGLDVDHKRLQYPVDFMEWAPMPPKRGSDEEQQGGQSGREPDDEFFDEDEGVSSNQHEGLGDEGEESLPDEGFEGGEEPSEQGESVKRPQRRPPDDRDLELVRLRAENEAFKRVQSQAPAAPPVQQGESDQQFEQRIAQLEPFEQLSARQQRSEQHHTQQMLILQVRTADDLDRATYATRAAYDQRYARYSEEVERRHQQFLTGGPNQPPQLIPRETILKLILGERSLQPLNREQRRQQEQQQRKLQRQQVRPPSNRSDAGGARERAGTGGTEHEARRRRLENVEI